MAVFRLTERAKEDLRSLGRYTRKTWGVEQRHYLRQPDDAFHLLGRAPELGQACDDVRLGYREYRVGQHLIFSRESSKAVEIIRGLHTRMDVATHLDDEE